MAQGERLAAEGADIIDIGGESTRPFSEPVAAEEEIRRVVPVIAELAQRVSAPISIDTTKSIVARRALEVGAAMVNDISALRCDPAVAAVAAEFGAPLFLMHMQGEPRTMQVAPAYDDLVGEIRDFLQAAAAAAEAQGVLHSMLIADPGIGFGKTPAHNLQLIQHLAEFAALDMPILVGPSRKSFHPPARQKNRRKRHRPGRPDGGDRHPGRRGGGNPQRRPHRARARCGELPWRRARWWMRS